MRIIIINKSDSTGGAAIVSRRLMEALRDAGEDAEMLVCEKLTDSPYVHLAATPKIIHRKFIIERLKIFLSNGFRRSTLFRIDTGEIGLKLWKNPIVKNADAILINWVNQGMLSLKGIKKILKLGKPVIFTMHDMWDFTGICHHSGKCEKFKQECGECPLLGWRASVDDMSHRVWKRKFKVYSHRGIILKPVFVGVSTWITNRALSSSLLKDKKVVTIPNPFNIRETGLRIREEGGKIRLLFGAARLDDPIKGLDTLKNTTIILKKDYPEIASRLELALFGTVKNPQALEGFAIPVIEMGKINGEEEIRKVYEKADILVSASSYETLPGTLVEAQAYGCVPVSFNRGGQVDIIEQLSTGYMAEYDTDPLIRAKNLAQGIIWAFSIVNDPLKQQQMINRMKKSVEDKFSYSQVARKYISLIENIKK